MIENKLDGSVPDRQAREINRHAANIDFDPEVRPISWPKVLDALSDLVDPERALVGGAEKEGTPVWRSCRPRVELVGTPPRGLRGKSSR